MDSLSLMEPPGPNNLASWWTSASDILANLMYTHRAARKDGENTRFSEKREDIFSAVASRIQQLDMLGPMGKRGLVEDMLASKDPVEVIYAAILKYHAVRWSRSLLTLHIEWETSAGWLFISESWEFALGTSDQKKSLVSALLPSGSTHHTAWQKVAAVNSM